MQIFRIDVMPKIADARAEVKKRYFVSLGLNGKINNVSVVDSYLISAELNAKECQAVAKMLANPVIEKAVLHGTVLPKKFDYAIEISFLPGVTDNVGHTVKEAIGDLLKRKFTNSEGVYTTQIFFIGGELTASDAKKIADSLHNPLIQRAKIKTFKQFSQNGGLGKSAPKVQLTAAANALSVDLNVPDKELAKLGQEGILAAKGRRGPLALDIEAIKTIKTHFKALDRPPTDVELESLGQTWSEHCKHTIFASAIDEIKNGLYQTYIKGATEAIRKKLGKKDFCVSVFKDNAGAIVFDNKFLVTHKVETHNSPSALDPFGGAITGIVGVNRDCLGFGLGAKPIINFYGYCLADPRDNTERFRDAELKSKLLSARRIMEGVVAGINSGGNCSGIPTPQGFALFEKRFLGKPLVFCGTVGLIPKTAKGRKLYQKQAKPGDCIVMVGGRVGLDGIHGATFSSEATHSGSPATAVQIGDPITQKKLSDAIVKEARDQGLFNSITDNGAGGLSSSVGEMAKESGGCEVFLDKVPLKYPGLEPWQIWVSESQERMTLAVPKNKWRAFEKLMQKRGVAATVIGQFTNSGKCVVKFREQTVMDLDMQFWHEGLPKKQLQTTHRETLNQEPPRQILPKNLNRAVLKLLSRPNIASFEFISRQYDHEVQAGSVLKPLQGRGRINGQATVTKPLLNSPKGVVLAQGINPTYSDINTYHMAAAALDTAIRNNVAAGGNLNHLALLDNFCWCSPNDPQRLGELKTAVQACYDYALAYGTPFISGKDSMFNDFKGYDRQGQPLKISIPPTLLVSSISVMADASKVVSEDLKFAGDLVYVLGETHAELGASEFFAMLSDEANQNFIGNAVPKVDAGKNKKIYLALQKAIDKTLVASSISVARAGLAAALSKTAMGGQLGLDISLAKLPGSVTANIDALFSESQGRIVVSVNPANREKFEKLFAGLPVARLGKVTEEKVLQIKGLESESIINLPIGTLTKAYRSTLNAY